MNSDAMARINLSSLLFLPGGRKFNMLQTFAQLFLEWDKTNLTRR
jgi:hypothetical protein